MWLLTPRRNQTPIFKAKVALAAIKGDRTLAQLAEQFDVQKQQPVMERPLLPPADSHRCPEIPLVNFAISTFYLVGAGRSLFARSVTVGV
jgi:hypothetical protein